MSGQDSQDTSSQDHHFLDSKYTWEYSLILALTQLVCLIFLWGGFILDVSIICWVILTFEAVFEIPKF